MKTHTIHMTGKQAAIISGSLETFLRMHLMQFEQVVDLFIAYDLPQQNFDAARNALARARFEMSDLGANSSWGIHSEKVPDVARQAYDIHCVIRHRLAFDRNSKGGFGVAFDAPLQTGALPLPKIRSYAQGAQGYVLHLCEKQLKIVQEAVRLQADLKVGYFCDIIRLFKDRVLPKVLTPTTLHGLGEGRTDEDRLDAAHKEFELAENLLYVNGDVLVPTVKDHDVLLNGLNAYPMKGVEGSPTMLVTEGGGKPILKWERVLHKNAWTTTVGDTTYTVTDDFAVNFGFQAMANGMILPGGPFVTAEGAMLLVEHTLRENAVTTLAAMRG